MKHPILHKSEAFSSNFARLILFYNNLAIALLQRKSNIHENIHQARLCFKRIRSLLRLGRPGMGERFYFHYNTFYRDLARSLSQLRDLTALTETLTAFIKTRKTEASKKFLICYKNMLIRQRRQQLGHIIAGDILENAINSLKNKSIEIADWDFNGKAPEVFISGATRIYRRGRKLFLISRSDASDHNMHEWRKQVKYFWYQLLVLTPLWPGMITAWAKEAQTLSQLLGKHHDLVLLEHAISSMNTDKRNTAILKSLRQSIIVRKLQLEKRCLILGAKLYAEDPVFVGKRLKAYWT
jgi:CHAD domain-containing protein